MINSFILQIDELDFITPLCRKGIVKSVDCRLSNLDLDIVEVTLIYA